MKLSLQKGQIEQDGLILNQPVRQIVVQNRIFYRLKDIADLNQLTARQLRLIFMTGQLDAYMSLFYVRRTGRYYVSLSPARESDHEFASHVYELKEEDRNL